MTGNIALDVAIGLVFIYCLYSLLTTTIAEFIAVIFQLRAKNLHRAISRMLDDGKTPVFADDFYKTPLVKYLASGRFSRFFEVNTKPSNIPPNLFSQGLLYLLKEGSQDELTPLQAIRKKLELPKDVEDNKINDTKKYLLFLLKEANGDIEKFTQSVEQWFDATMERCIGWYKKNMSFITLFLGLLLATIFNIDSFKIVSELSKDPKAREQYVQLAGQLVQNPLFTETAPTFDSSLYNRLLSDPDLIKKSGNNKVRLEKMANDSVLGHFFSTQKAILARMDNLYQLSEQPRNILSFERTSKKSFKWFYSGWVNFLGCLVTAIALALGAPFWFDLLNKLMKLRNSVSIGKTTDTTTKTGSETITKPAVG
jgi:hypothetical protein